MNIGVRFLDKSFYFNISLLLHTQIVANISVETKMNVVNVLILREKTTQQKIAMRQGTSRNCVQAPNRRFLLQDIFKVQRILEDNKSQTREMKEKVSDPR